MMPKVTIYRINGETADVLGVDAREAVGNHPREWSYQPWLPADMRKAADEAAKRGMVDPA